MDLGREGSKSGANPTDLKFFMTLGLGLGIFGKVASVVVFLALYRNLSTSLLQTKNKGGVEPSVLSFSFGYNLLFLLSNCQSRSLLRGQTPQQAISMPNSRRHFELSLS